MTTSHSAHRRPKPAFAAGLGVLALLALYGGCGPKLEYALVEGTVTLDGATLPEVEVVFYPDPDKGTQGPRSAAYTDAQGHYRLRDDRGRSGAPLGFCRVCVTDIRAIPFIPQGLPETAAGVPFKVPPKSRVPSQYGHWTQTPLRDVEVKPGAQTLNFDVHSGKTKH
jgi:hypothetical protein